MTPVQGAGKPIPNDVAWCPRCRGSIYFVDTLVDTLDEQVRTWLCDTCIATGTIAMTMTMATTPEYHPAPSYSSLHYRSRKAVSV